MKFNAGGNKSSRLGLLAAVVAGEAASIVYGWFAPWFISAGDRNFMTAVACNVLLAIMIRTITEKYWYVSAWKDCGILGLWLSIFYTILEAPNLIVWYNPFSATYVIGKTAHHFVVMTAIIATLLFFKQKVKL